MFLHINVFRCLSALALGSHFAQTVISWLLFIIASDMFVDCLSLLHLSFLHWLSVISIKVTVESHIRSVRRRVPVREDTCPGPSAL